MAKKKKNWIQGVVKSMKKNKTEGAFTKYCGGKVTEDCIKRGLNSPNPKVRARARLAKAFRNMKKALGGEVSENTVDFLNNLKETFINSLSDASLQHLVQDIEEAFRKNQAYDRINTFAGELLTRKYGGNIKKYQEGGPNMDVAEPPMMQQAMGEPSQQQGLPQQQGQPQQGAPDITYEQYVQFIISYPDYLERFLQDVEKAKQMQASGQQPTEGQPMEGQPMEGQPEEAI